MYVREYLGFVASIYKTGLSKKTQIDTIIDLTGLARNRIKRSDHSLRATGKG